MTDLRKVISPLNVPTVTNTTNVVGVPEGDKPVFLSNMGFLTTDYPLVLHSVGVSTGNTSATLAAQNSNEQVLVGSYFGQANVTLQPSDLDPRRLFIIGSNSSGADKTLTFPDPGDGVGTKGIIPYLKNTFGPENIVPGFSWTIDFVNDQLAAADPSGSGMILQINAPVSPTQTVTVYGMLPSGANYFNIIKGGDVAAPPRQKYSKKITFIVTNVTTGSEGLTYICHF